MPCWFRITSPASVSVQPRSQRSALPRVLCRPRSQPSLATPFSDYSPCSRISSLTNDTIFYQASKEDCGNHLHFLFLYSHGHRSPRAIDFPKGRPLYPFPPSLQPPTPGSASLLPPCHSQKDISPLWMVSLLRFSPAGSLVIKAKRLVWGASPGSSYHVPLVRPLPTAKDAVMHHLCTQPASLSGIPAGPHAWAQGHHCQERLLN